MMKNTKRKMTEIERLELQLKKARARVLNLELQIDLARRKAVRSVEFSRKKNQETITLKFRKRVLKVKSNPRYSGWDVYENGKKIVSEYLASIYELRYAISQGEI